jgi:hypothetical protein
MFIESKSLILRKLTIKDISENYVSWLNDEEINSYLEIRHTRQTFESCKIFIDACNNDNSSHLFGIFLKDNPVCHGGFKRLN